MIQRSVLIGMLAIQLLPFQASAEDLIYTTRSSRPLRGVVTSIGDTTVTVRLVHDVTIGLARADIVCVTRDGYALSLETGEIIIPLPTQTPTPLSELVEGSRLPVGTAETHADGEPRAEENPESAETPEPERFLRVTGRGVRLRGGPSTGFPVRGKLRLGDLVRQATEVDYWHRVFAGPGAEGWVYGDLVEPVSSTPSVVAGFRVNLRNRPDLAAAVLGQVTEGVRIYGFEARNGWTRVWVPGDQFAWMASRYVQPISVPEKGETERTRKPPR